MKKQNNVKLIPCFKRWSRKGYGVFASLHRYVKIGVLCVSMSILLPATSTAQKQNGDADTLTVIRLEAANVVGNKASPTRSAMSQTLIFNRADEEVAPLQTIEAALRQSPSIDVRERGGKGIQTDISIRGGSFDQTMIMLNGINFSDAQTGHHAHLLPVDVECISGIDLIDGVSGVGAFAGAINVRTQPILPKYLRAELSGGQHGYLYANISGAAKINDVSIFGATSYRRSDGYTTNTEFDVFKAFLRTTYENSKIGFFDLQLGYQSRWFAANGFYSLKYNNQFEHTSTALASLRWVKQISTGLTINSSVSYRTNFDRFELIKDEPDNEPYNFHNTDNIGMEIYADYKSMLGTTSFGGDYTYNHIYSTGLGEKLDNPKKISGYKDKFYTHGKHRNVGNVWLRHKKQFDKFDLAFSGGLSFTSFENAAIWSASFGYAVSENIKIDVGANQSMRLPTFTDLYYTQTGYVGNVNLVPEKAITYQIQANYLVEKLKINTNLYYRRGRNIIDWVRDDADGDWYSKQITDLNTFGVEFLGQYNFNAFVKNIKAKYGYISTSKNSSAQISRYALDYMRHKFIFSVDIRPLRNISLALTASVYDRNGEYIDKTGATKNFKPFFLLDARAAWERNGLKIYVDATNITCTKYFDFGGLDMPRIWASGGVAITIK